MPSKSKKQFRLMEAVAHDKGFAKKAGIPQSVGQDFADADKAEGTKYKKLPTYVTPKKRGKK